MIINVQGLPGAGKSTLVREIMFLASRKIGVWRPDLQLNRGRRKKPKHPDGYILEFKSRDQLFVLGHYESHVGGADHMRPGPAFDLIREMAERHYDILVEGGPIQRNPVLLHQLNEDGYDVRVVQLKVPLKMSLRAADRRRAEHGLGPFPRRGINGYESRTRMWQIYTNVLRHNAVEIREFKSRYGALRSVKAQLELV